MRRILSHIWRCWLCWLLAVAATAASAENAGVDFTLPVRGSGDSVSLKNLRGKVVVLDFFAHWCVPCVKCSAEVETGVRAYYDNLKGNPRGVPVEVLAINIESARPEKTEAFIKRARLQRVLEDAGGKVFQQFGGEGLPFIVVIDATGNESDSARILYRKAGFEGVAALRQQIDRAGEGKGLTPTSVPSTTETGRTGVAQGPPPSAIPETPQISVAGQGITGVKEPGSAAASATPKPDPAVLAPSVKPGPVQPHTNAASAPSETTQAEMPETSSAVLHRLLLDAATLVASDIWLTDESLEYRQTRPGSDISVSFLHGHTHIDYEPESLLGLADAVDNNRYGFQTQGRLDLGHRVRLQGGGGGYRGYMDYRSLWLDEHFRQLYSQRRGYETAHPWGYNLSGGARWEYLPASGFAEFNLSYQHDIISPGYEVRLLPFPPTLIRFRDDYDTISGRLSVEQVLTPRMRGKLELQILDTTDRELRYAGQGSLNWALAEHWVARLTLAGTKEAPQFEAWSTGGTLERDWNETWFVSVMARYYSDTGQIENALLAENTAAPPLEAIQVGLGLRWQGQRTSLKFTIGPYFSRYDSAAAASGSFSNLYKNRDWISAQLAFAQEF
jgi:thiol-disulfide isomerase/thioredoxin